MKPDALTNTSTPKTVAKFLTKPLSPAFFKKGNFINLSATVFIIVIGIEKERKNRVNLMASDDDVVLPL